MRGVRGGLVRVVSWLVITVSAAAVTGAVVVPRLAGATPYAVLTGSMQPAHPAGSLVVVRPRPAEQVAVGDVITYQLVSGRADVVTHRVVAVRRGADGTTSFVTRGDANRVDDREPVRDVQVRGVVWYSVPHLGRVHVLLTGPEHRLLVRLVALVLLGYAATMFVLAALAGRARRRAESPRTPAVTHG